MTEWDVLFSKQIDPHQINGVEGEFANLEYSRCVALSCLGLDTLIEYENPLFQAQGYDQRE